MNDPGAVPAIAFVIAVLTVSGAAFVAQIKAIRGRNKRAVRGWTAVVIALIVFPTSPLAAPAFVVVGIYWLIRAAGRKEWRVVSVVAVSALASILSAFIWVQVIKHSIDSVFYDNPQSPGVVVPPPKRLHQNVRNWPKADPKFGGFSCM